MDAIVSKNKPTFSLLFFEAGLKEEKEKKGRTCTFFSFICDNVSMPKRKCDENAKEKSCGIYSICCVYIEIMLLGVNRLQKVRQCYARAFKLEETKHSSHIFLRQNDSGTE